MADDAKSVPFVLKCNVCGSSSSLKRCSRCKQVVYCSREHQLKDWSAHKLSCQVTLGQNRPKSNMCEVITLSSCRHAQSTRSINDEIGPTNETPQHPWHQQHNVNEDETSSITNPNEKYNVETSRNVDNNTMCQGNKDVRIKTDKETRFALESNRTKHEDDILCEYTPFDKRPLIERHFGKPKSKNIRNLAMFVMDNLNNNNFCVVDSLFEDHHLDRVLAEIKSLDAKSQLKTGKLAGGRTSDDNNQKELRAEIRSDRMAWVDRNQEDIPQIGRAVERLDSIMTDLNSLFEDKDCFINSRTKVMVTCYPGEGTCYRRHVDNPTKDGRRITCILYLNRDWNVQTDGGLLRIFPAGSADQYVDIPPLFNRLLFFWSDSRNPHEVQPSYRARYAMTVWYFDEMERNKAKEEKCHIESMKIRGTIALTERDRREEEKARIQREIDSQAEQAVDSLSQNELQALAELTRDLPNKREVLGQMGIAECIQEVLIKAMEKL